MPCSTLRGSGSSAASTDSGLDTINFYFCDRALRDNPPLPPGQRNASIAPDVNPYNHQEHLYDKNQPENLEFLRRLRGLMDEYPAVAAVGEIGDAQRGMELMGEYTAGDERMHMCYAFEFLSGERVTAGRVVEVLGRFDEAAADGWPCWAFSNHDVARHASRWKLGPEARKVVASLLLSLRGSVCLYQGEELGLDEADVAFDDLQDPYGIEFWPDFKGRDGCRTPMPWTAASPNGGFSDARPWLPVSPDHLPLSAAAQENDGDSLLNHYRRALDFRKANPALVAGELGELSAHGDVVSFSREEAGATLFCAFNLGAETARVELPTGKWAALDASGFEADTEGRTLVLPPWQAYFAVDASEAV